MRNILIGTILHSLMNEYESGACDNMDPIETENLLDDLNRLKDKLEMKQDITMTTEEVSQYLGVTRQTVKNYVDQGLLHPKKQLGGVLQFTKKEVKQLIKRTKQ